MQTNDTINLLKECDAGTKMAVLSIDEILDYVQNQKLKEMLVEFKDKHTNLGNEIHILLNQQEEEDKEPSPMAKGMSWVKTNPLVDISINMLQQMENQKAFVMN